MTVKVINVNVDSRLRNSGMTDYTAEDEAVINSYLPEPHPDGTPIDPSELPSSLPAHLINLKSELRIEGAVVATGGPYLMGTRQTTHMNFSGPAWGTDIVSNNIYAGEYYGIAVDVARISKGMMEGVKARLESTKAKLEAGDYAGLTKDELLGDLLFTTAMTYYAEYDVMDEIQARTIGVNNIRVPSVSIFKTTVNIEEAWGMPVSVSAGGLVMDVDRNLTVTKAKDGNRSRFLQFMKTSGINSSKLEHSVPVRLFNTPENPVYGVSAVRAIQIASSQEIPIYIINKQNVDTVIPQLQLDDSTIQEMRNAINAGNEVTTSKTNINFHGWEGCGYIVFNPVNGTGGYMITGQENGGLPVMTWEMHLLVAATIATYTATLMKILTVGGPFLVPNLLLLGASFYLYYEGLKSAIDSVYSGSLTRDNAKNNIKAASYAAMGMNALMFTSFSLATNKLEELYAFGATIMGDILINGLLSLRQ